MTVDFTNIVQFIFGIAISAVCYFYNQLKSKTDKTYDDFQAYKLHVSETYVNTAELNKAIDSLTKSVDSVAQGVIRIEGRFNQMHTDRRSAT